jgi:hypothetical protein
LFELQSLSMVHAPPIDTFGAQPVPGMHRMLLGHSDVHTSQCDGPAARHAMVAPFVQMKSSMTSVVQLGRHCDEPSGALPHAPGRGHAGFPLPHGCPQLPSKLQRPEAQSAPVAHTS